MTKIISEETFKSLPSMNETEVRFHIIDPAMRRLGYPNDEGVFLKLEERLEYPYYFIGRKNKKKDLPLGFPDYRAGLKGGRGSFIVEAKAANVELSNQDVEQAHSYAAHSQTGANYFVLCNGHKLVVYETLSGTEPDPIVSVPIGEFEDRFHEIENILSPTSLKKNCQVSYDTGLKLCDGLGSSEKIRSGKYDTNEWSYKIFINDSDQTELLQKTVPQVQAMDDQLALIAREFELRVCDGVAQRGPDGMISALVQFSGITKNSQAGMEMLGLDTLTFFTDDKTISKDPSNPTVFETAADFSLNKGDKFPPLFGDAMPMASNLTGDMFITARMFVKDRTILGKYLVLTDYDFGEMGDNAIRMELNTLGSFHLELV